MGLGAGVHLLRAVDDVAEEARVRRRAEGEELGEGLRNRGEDRGDTEEICGRHVRDIGET